MKILFYGNEWSDFKEFVGTLPALEREGIEIAVATSNYALVESLSIGKLLVVTPESYFDDFTVIPDGYKPLKDKKCYSFSEFKEMIA